MARFNEHIKDCENILGHGYNKVHRWLDNYADVFPIKIYGGYHRTFRHNKWGLHQIKNNWGEKAMEAGKIHLVRDVYDIYDKRTFDILDYKNYIGKALIYFNDPAHMEPLFAPAMIHERMNHEDTGMVAIAEEEGYFE